MERRHVPTRDHEQMLTDPISVSICCAVTLTPIDYTLKAGTL